VEKQGFDRFFRKLVPSGMKFPHQSGFGTGSIVFSISIIKEKSMTKKALMGLSLAAMVAGSVSAADFGKISSALGPGSFTTDVYGGFATSGWALNGNYAKLGVAFKKDSSIPQR
jgi:hypothetical protein